MIDAFVPLRSLTEGKSRLARMLSPADRCSLIEKMGRHVVDVLTLHPDIDRVFVVSADPVVKAMADGLGAIGIDECANARGDLNAALHASLLAPCACPIDMVMIVHADLPYLSASSIDLLIGMLPDFGAVIAPDQHMRGTNAILMPAKASVDLSFGPESFTRHLEAFKCAALPLRLAVEPGLSNDLDTEEDYSAFVRWAATTKRPVPKIVRDTKVSSSSNKPSPWTSIPSNGSCTIASRMRWHAKLCYPKTVGRPE